MSVTLIAGTFQLVRANSPARHSVTDENDVTHDVYVHEGRYVTQLPDTKFVSVEYWSHMVIIVDMLNKDFNEDDAKALIDAHERRSAKAKACKIRCAEAKARKSRRADAKARKSRRANATEQLSRQGSSSPKPI